MGWTNKKKSFFYALDVVYCYLILVKTEKKISFEPLHLLILTSMWIQTRLLTPIWIRNGIQLPKTLWIHGDPDPQPWYYVWIMLHNLLFFLNFFSFQNNKSFLTPSFLHRSILSPSDLCYIISNELFFKYRVSSDTLKKYYEIMYILSQKMYSM